MSVPVTIAPHFDQFTNWLNFSAKDLEGLVNTAHYRSGVLMATAQAVLNKAAQDDADSLDLFETFFGKYDKDRFTKIQERFTLMQEWLTGTQLTYLADFGKNFQKGSENVVAYVMVQSTSSWNNGIFICFPHFARMSQIQAAAIVVHELAHGVHSLSSLRIGDSPSQNYSFELNGQTFDYGPSGGTYGAENVRMLARFAPEAVIEVADAYSLFAMESFFPISKWKEFEKDLTSPLSDGDG